MVVVIATSLVFFLFSSSSGQTSGFEGHESRLLPLVSKVVSRATVSSSSSGEKSGFKGHESRVLIIVVGKVVSTIGHNSRLLLLPNSNLIRSTRERQSKYLLASR